MVSTKTLGVIALGGAMLCSGTGILLHNRLQNKFKEEPYFQEALQTFKNHNAVKILLGEPIRVSKLNMGDSSNFVDILNAELNVPVIGPKAKGVMYFWASRDSVGEQWMVDRIEFELSNDKSKRLLVKKQRSE